MWFHDLRSFQRAQASSLFRDACSSSWVTFLNAGLDQSLPVRSRALSSAQLTGNQVTLIIPGEPRVVFSHALSFLASSLRDHPKASHTNFGTIEAPATPWQVNPQSLADTPLSEQPSKHPVHWPPSRTPRPKQKRHSRRAKRHVITGLSPALVGDSARITQQLFMKCLHDLGKQQELFFLNAMPEAFAMGQALCWVIIYVLSYLSIKQPHRGRIIILTLQKGKLRPRNCQNLPEITQLGNGGPKGLQSLRFWPLLC